jgi:hypothetical protein
MITLFSIQNVEQKELFFKLSNAFSLRENAVLGRKVSGLYAIFQDGVCHYVGLSTNLPSRLATHLRGKYSSCAAIQVYLPEENGFSDFYERNESERKEILSLNEKALMALLKPVDNIDIDMDFKLEEKYSFEGFSEESSTIPIELKLHKIEDKLYCQIKNEEEYSYDWPAIFSTDSIHEVESYIANSDCFDMAREAIYMLDDAKL